MNSDPATSTDTALPASAANWGWVCHLLQAGDSFYPTGSYAHSFGLEGLVQEGVVRDAAGLRHFLFHAALPALRRVDLPLTAHAWRAFAGPDWPRVRELCFLSSAARGAREPRVASESIGRQRAELAAALHRASLAREFLARASAGGWPHSAAVSAALEGQIVGAPLPAVLAGVSYASVGALVSAAMKVLRLGQNAAQALLTEAMAEMPRLIAEAVETPQEEIGWFNPWLDIAAARHEAADARMFIS